MKNKRLLNVLLLIGLVGLWGMIIYKVVDHLRSEDPYSDTATAYSTSHASNAIDTLRLLLDYEDPFAWGYKSVSSRSETPARPRVSRSNGSGSRVSTIRESYRNSQNVNQSATVHQRITWPKVEYFGLVSTRGNADMMAMIQVNNQSLLFEKGQQKGEITLVQCYADSAVLEYGGQRRSFARKGDQ